MDSAEREHLGTRGWQGEDQLLGIPEHSRPVAGQMQTLLLG